MSRVTQRLLLITTADELPFSALSGRRFEILGYLLEIDDADENASVTSTFARWTNWAIKNYPQKMLAGANSSC